jgi:hypothetical protein
MEAGSDETAKAQSTQSFKARACPFLFCSASLCVLLLDAPACEFYEGLVQVMTSGKFSVPREQAEDQAFRRAFKSMTDISICNKGDHSNCKNAMCYKGNV